MYQEETSGKQQLKLVPQTDGDRIHGKESKQHQQEVFGVRSLRCRKSATLRGYDLHSLLSISNPSAAHTIRASGVLKTFQPSTL